MRFYIVKISVDGNYERFPTVYFTREAAEKICAWQLGSYQKNNEEQACKRLQRREPCQSCAVRQTLIPADGMEPDRS